MKFVLLALLCALPWAAASAQSAARSAPERTIALEQAYDITLASDQSIGIAALEIRKANLLPWSALTRLGPSLTGNGSYNRSETTLISPARTTDAAGNIFLTPATSRRESRSGTLDFSQPLIDFTVFPAFRLGRLSQLAAKLQYQFTIRQTLFGVARAYYLVLKDQSVVEINRQTLDLAQKQLELAQNRYEAGDVARLDVSRARATLEDSRTALIQNENTLAIDRNTLGNILNLGGDTGFRLTDPPNAPVLDDSFDEAFARAQANREDFKIARIAIDQDIARRNEIIGEYAPRVVASGALGFDNSRGTSSDSQNWAAGVSVSVPFFTGGQREIDLITANRQVEQTRLNFETTAKNLQQEVKNAWLQVGTAQATLKSLRAEVDANLQNYNDLQAQYQAGAATSLDVQSALRDLNNSRTSLTTQRYDFQTALRDLQRAQANFQEERIQKLKK